MSFLKKIPLIYFVIQNRFHRNKIYHLMKLKISQIFNEIIHFIFFSLIIYYVLLNTP